jgi:hypothetical protein
MYPMEIIIFFAVLMAAVVGIVAYVRWDARS